LEEAVDLSCDRLLMNEVGRPGREITFLQRFYLNMTIRTQKDGDIYPCAKWDSNPRSQRSSNMWQDTS
jgi:hypothetical protein